MAITQGHGNPAWTEDEIILALDLYFELDAKIPDASDPRVVALSGLLRSLPYHAEAARKASFRNAAGVVFKLQNLRSVAIGKGLSNTSRTDRSVWERWGDNPPATRLQARLIRSAIETALSHQSLIGEFDDDVFAEGRAVTQAHQRREREPKLRKKLLRKRRDSHTLHCDICGFRNLNGDSRFDDAGLEVHHLRPLSKIDQTLTKLSELALLCATCHRLAHRAIATEGHWLRIEEIRAILAQRPEIHLRSNCATHKANETTAV